MILAHGNLYEDRELVPLREGLAEACARTMAGPPLESGVVVEACGELLCSSCQGIFLDTEDMGAVQALGERFFALLREENRACPPADVGLQAKAALHLCGEELEAHRTGRRILRGGGVSVTVCPDSELELSLLAGNCWVKPLPRRRIVHVLSPEKGRLQTAGLLCPPEERPALSALLARAGVVRVTWAGDMSRTLPGEAHDGLYPLQLYSRIVEFG